jgi:hypothetical protein
MWSRCSRLDCAKGWAYAGATSKTTLTAEADAIPLVLKSSASGARVEDFAIHAADAVTEGGSSIAVLADGATAELVRCELVSGDGAKGADGEDGDPTGASAKEGTAGSAGKKACSDLDGTPGPDGTLLGGAQVTNDCGSDEISIGGSGGDGNVTNGGGGDIGQTGTKGQAGLGQPLMGMWDLVGWLVLVDKVLACRAPDAPEVRVAKVVTAVPEAVGSEAPRSASPSRAARRRRTVRRRSRRARRDQAVLVGA